MNNVIRFFVLFLAFFVCQYSTAESDFTPLVIDTNVTRRVMGSVMRPEGSTLCDGKPTFWFTGHYNPGEVMFCEESYNVLTKKPIDWVERIDRHGCTTFDVNKDGLDDVLCTRGGSKGTGTESYNEVYLAQVNGTFTKILNHGMESPSSRSKDFLFFKSDSDDDLVFESVNAAPRTDGLPNHNQLYKWVSQQEDGKYFVKLPGPWDEEKILPYVVKAEDFDGDGRLDLFVYGKKYKRNGRDKMVMKIYLQRNKNTFVDLASKRLDVEYEAATVADLNGDGQPDIIGFSARIKRFYVLWNVSKQTPNKRLHFYENKFAFKTYKGKRRYGKKYYVGGLAVLDVNGDGLLDVYATQSSDGKNKYCDRKVKSGFRTVANSFRIGSDVDDVVNFIPPHDPISDILFINRGIQNTTSLFAMFDPHEMNLDLRGCAGHDLVPFGEKRLAISYSSIQYPGRMYLLDWS